MAGAEWVQELGIVGVTVRGCVCGNSVAVRILTDMVAYQVCSQGRRNLTLLDLKCIALLHPEMGLQQLLVMPLTSCPHPQRLGHWGWKPQRQSQPVLGRAGLENARRAF